MQFFDFLRYLAIKNIIFDLVKLRPDYRGRYVFCESKKSVIGRRYLWEIINETKKLVCSSPSGVSQFTCICGCCSGG